MLMPILTVKAAAAATAHTVVVVETATPKDRTATLPPIRISGRQSDAMLKILETLNRHLVGSEPLPRDALIRLLDTLAKVLKFPPLPQESLRDFSKRLAVFLETLPPAVRQAVEKQLGQRNLAVSVRILTEALKMPSLLDTPRLPDRAFTPLTPGRTLLTQPETRPVQALPVQPQPVQQYAVRQQSIQQQPIQQQPSQQQSIQQQPPQGKLAIQQQPLPAAQVPPHGGSNPMLASASFVPDPGVLQAALKKAFGDDDEPVAVPTIALEEHETDHDAMPGVGRRDDGAKAQTPRSSDTAAASTSARMPAKASEETIPLLRAAAAFLAADPEALSQVSAITSGEIDSQVITRIQEELNLPLPEPLDATEWVAAQPDPTAPQLDWEQPEQAMQPALPETMAQAEPVEQWLDWSPPDPMAQPELMLPEQERTPQPQAEQPAEYFEEPAQKPTVRTEPENRFGRPAEPTRERQVTTPPLQAIARQELPTQPLDPQTVATRIVAKPETPLQNTTPPAQPILAKNSEEVAGFRGHDLGEWELHIESPAQLLAPSEDSPLVQFEPEENPDEGVFSQALKALVEASLPLPEGVIERDASETLFSALAGETADMDAEILFARLEASEDAVMLPDATLLTGNIGSTAENSMFEAGTLSTLLETPDDRNANRVSFSHAAITDEPSREAQPQKQPETGFARDAIPFAMIPYLPAKTEGMKPLKEEGDDQPSFAGHDEGEQGDNRDAHDEQESQPGSEPSMDSNEDRNEAGDAYNLYRSMGGLG